MVFDDDKDDKDEVIDEEGLPEVEEEDEDDLEDEDEGIDMFGAEDPESGRDRDWM